MHNTLDSFEVENKKDAIEYAGFWIRFGASIIDGLVMLPIMGIVFYNYISIKSLFFALVCSLLMAIYKPFMEFKYGATFGKMATNLKVVNLNYEPITLNQSIIRYSPWIVGHVINLLSLFTIFGNDDFSDVQSYTEFILFSQDANSFEIFGSFLLFVVAIIIAFDPKKRGGHDMLAKTYCIHS